MLPAIVWKIVVRSAGAAVKAFPVVAIAFNTAVPFVGASSAIV